MKYLDKIKPLKELAGVLERERRAGRKVVHCHGVFDLVHIGHVRHLERAKAFGDILVITLTPDQHVNKGPHRPIFNQNLRAEAVAALSCTDYVAVNEWPTAVETLRLLKPDFYVKGSDYKNPETDVTGGIIREREAVESGGGKLVFTDDIMFSSTHLINANLNSFPQETRAWLGEFSQRYSLDDLRGFIEQVKKLNVLVVGEGIIDEYQYCQAIGKSGKEPILAVKHESTERFAGGTLAVANHISNFAGKVGLVTFLGDRNREEDFIREHLDGRIDAHFLTRTDSPTIIKRRYIESYFFSKLMAVYEINDDALEPQDDKILCSTLHEQVEKYDVVVVVDYGHSMMSNGAIDIVCRESRFLAVNAQANAGNMGYHTISTYPRMDFACMTDGEIRQEERDRRGPITPIVQRVADRLRCGRMVVTRGSKGCLAYSRGEGFFDVPAFGGKVVDRMGAGDSFLSLTAPCAALGIPMEVTAFLGNIMGAQAVATVGHRKSVDKAAVIKNIESLLK